MNKLINSKNKEKIKVFEKIKFKINSINGHFQAHDKE
jgi:hypothetical protein